MKSNHRRIDFHYDSRLRSIWHACSPRHKGTTPSIPRDCIRVHPSSEHNSIPVDKWGLRCWRQWYLHLLLQFISSVLKESSDIDTQIRAAAEAFVAMKDVFLDTKISVKSQAIVHADSKELRQACNISSLMHAVACYCLKMGPQMRTNGSKPGLESQGRML